MPGPNDRWIALQAAIAVALAGLFASARAADDEGARKGWHFYKEPAEESDGKEGAVRAMVGVRQGIEPILFQAGGKA